MMRGLEKPVFRIGVNTMGTLGSIGLTTQVMPSLTLGAGGIGGSITGDNVGVYHLFNIKRMAFFGNINGIFCKNDRIIIGKSNASAAHFFGTTGDRLRRCLIC